VHTIRSHSEKLQSICGDYFQRELDALLDWNDATGDKRIQLADFKRVMGNFNARDTHADKTSECVLDNTSQNISIDMSGVPRGEISKTPVLVRKSPPKFKRSPNKRVVTEDDVSEESYQGGMRLHTE